ncbi:hypothetical protein DPEC_G00192080 [Dallia pectoralis]|uniref:Uncharacterized protein n=1 Tax=Dallia pectoralis TaxID=75939 RepID=A0ACC2GCF2_DALPE|nr:hypothetical protein DPEC_G00192080 [Dallia pectoralis]
MRKQRRDLWGFLPEPKNLRPERPELYYRRAIRRESRFSLQPAAPPDLLSGVGRDIPTPQHPPTLPMKKEELSFEDIARNFYALEGYISEEDLPVLPTTYGPIFWPQVQWECVQENVELGKSSESFISHTMNSDVRVLVI